MSEHTVITSKPVALPDPIKVTQTLAMLDDMDTDVKYLTKLLKETNNELRSLIGRVNKMRMMLEAK